MRNSTSPSGPEPVNRGLRRYVLPTEKVVLATRRHWAALLEPAVTASAVFVLVAAIVLNTPAHLQDAAGWLWLLWLAALGRFGFRWLEWRHEWFVSTDKRLLLLYGLVIHKVAMMPLAKVTDMGYSRTPLGQILGYGRFVMESAGQDQALHQIDYVPRPDDTYRTLCAELFRPTAPKPQPDAGTAHTGQRPEAHAQQAWQPDADHDDPPVVVVPGRRDGDEPKPTTQPIAVTQPHHEPAPSSTPTTTASSSTWPLPDPYNDLRKR